VTCLSLDVVRAREQRQAERMGGSSLLTRVIFALGILTTALVMLAWFTNLVHKPLATAFGGTVTAIGLLVAWVNYTRLNRHGIPVTFPSEVRSPMRDSVLVLLPPGGDPHGALARAAAAVADGSPVFFLYRGSRKPEPRRPQLFEVVDPYLDDRAAQAAFGRVERVAEGLDLPRRYVYIPANGETDTQAVGQIWQTLQPRETLALESDADAVHGLAIDRVRRPVGHGAPIVHYVKHWPSSH
jgi:hypothetical protein